MTATLALTLQGKLAQTGTQEAGAIAGEASFLKNVNHTDFEIVASLAETVAAATPEELDLKSESEGDHNTEDLLGNEVDLNGINVIAFHNKNTEGGDLIVEPGAVEGWAALLDKITIPPEGWAIFYAPNILDPWVIDSTHKLLKFTSSSGDVEFEVFIGGMLT